MFPQSRHLFGIYIPQHTPTYMNVPVFCTAAGCYRCTVSFHRPWCFIKSSRLQENSPAYKYGGWKRWTLCPCQSSSMVTSTLEMPTSSSTPLLLRPMPFTFGLVRVLPQSFFIWIPHANTGHMTGMCSWPGVKRFYLFNYFNSLYRLFFQHASYLSDDHPSIQIQDIYLFIIALTIPVVQLLYSFLNPFSSWRLTASSIDPNHKGEHPVLNKVVALYVDVD